MHYSSDNFYNNITKYKLPIYSLKKSVLFYNNKIIQTISLAAECALLALSNAKVAV